MAFLIVYRRILTNTWPFLRQGEQEIIYFLKKINFAIHCSLCCMALCHVKFSNYLMKSMQNYLTPEIEVLEVMPEGVLCGSLDMDPEEGNMW